MTVGILALQGDYLAHRNVLESLALANRVLDVRTASELEACDGLVIPGGESTTMCRLCDRYDLWTPLQHKLECGMGALGTCAGLILLAKNIEGATKNFQQKTLRVLDVDVARNAYGAQADSFEADLELKTGNWNMEVGRNDDAAFSSQHPHSAFQTPTTMRAVFIRAPRIVRVGEGVEVLARHDGEAVAVQQGNIFGCAFHPEIAGETRLHEFWLRTLTPKNSV